jgi:chromate reductase
MDGRASSWPDRGQQEFSMSTPRKVAGLVGSLRKGAFNRFTANALAAWAPSRMELQIIEIGQLTLYNQDEDVAPPAAWSAFRAAIEAVDAVLFVTPEHTGRCRRH